MARPLEAVIPGICSYLLFVVFMPMAFYSKIAATINTLVVSYVVFLIEHLLYKKNISWMKLTRKFNILKFLKIKSKPFVIFFRLLLWMIPVSFIWILFSRAHDLLVANGLAGLVGILPSIIIGIVCYFS